MSFKFKKEFAIPTLIGVMTAGCASDSRIPTLPTLPSAQDVGRVFRNPLQSIEEATTGVIDYADQKAAEFGAGQDPERAKKIQKNQWALNAANCPQIVPNGLNDPATKRSLAAFVEANQGNISKLFDFANQNNMTVTIDTNGLLDVIKSAGGTHNGVSVKKCEPGL